MENFFEDLKTSVLELLVPSGYSLSTAGNDQVLGLYLHKRNEKIIIHAVKDSLGIIINARSGHHSYKGSCFNQKSCSVELDEVKKFLLQEFN